MGTTEVEPTAIGRPAGEDFEFIRLVFDGLHLVTLHIVDNEVALGVEHLNLIEVGRMEALHGFVGRVGNELELGVPGRIDTCREQGLVAHVDLLHLSVVGNEGASVGLTGMELHALGVPLLIAMAVDALASGFSCAEHVIDNDLFIERLQTTLVDGQFLIRHIRR